MAIEKIFEMRRLNHYIFENDCEFLIFFHQVFRLDLRWCEQLPTVLCEEFSSLQQLPKGVLKWGPSEAEKRTLERQRTQRSQGALRNGLYDTIS